MFYNCELCKVYETRFLPKYKYQKDTKKGNVDASLFLLYLISECFLLVVFLFDFHFSTNNFIDFRLDKPNTDR